MSNSHNGSQSDIIEIYFSMRCSKHDMRQYQKLYPISNLLIVILFFLYICFCLREEAKISSWKDLSRRLKRHDLKNRRTSIMWRWIDSLHNSFGHPHHHLNHLRHEPRDVCIPNIPKTRGFSSLPHHFFFFLLIWLEAKCDSFLPSPLPILHLIWRILFTFIYPFLFYFSFPSASFRLKRGGVERMMETSSCVINSE